MLDKVIKYRWWIIVISIAGTLLFSINLKNLEIDADLKNYFPGTMESMVNTDRIEEMFGNQDIMMMLFVSDDVLKASTLERIRDIEKELGRLGSVTRTTSLFGSNHIYGEDGVMYVEPAIGEIPHTGVERDRLREEIRNNDLIYKVVVADDFTSSAIIITLEKGCDEGLFFEETGKILEAHPGDEQVLYGGLPYIREEMSRDIKRDALILVPFALLFMTIFLIAVFREWGGVLLPFLVVILSTLLAVSFIPLIGWKFYIVTLLVPVMLIAVANDYGIHIFAKYQELNAAGVKGDMATLARIIVRKLWVPVVLAGVTTIAGISGLLAHTMIPARQMALIAGIGIVFSLLFSLILMPAILSTMKRSKPLAIFRHQQEGESGILHRFGDFVVRNNRKILLYSLIITLVVSTGMVFLRVDSNEINFFPEKHQVRIASKLIDQKYGGSQNISVMFGGDMMDPEILRKMEDYENQLKQLSDIDLVIGFPGIVKEISKALNDPGSPLYNEIPPTREAVAQYMMLYSMNGDPAELEQLIDFTYTHAHMIVRIKDVNNRKVNNIIKTIRRITAGDEHVEAIGGYAFVTSQLATKVVKGQFYSLGIALVVIFILVALIFRSVMAGLMGSIPLVTSILLLFGIMGLTGIHLDVATALLSSLMIGVGIDYTIHFFWRYIEERRKSPDRETAVVTALSTTGRGIIFNALSVIVGFVVLVVSSFTPIRFFGILVVVTIFSCLAGALLIIPSLIIRFRIGFLERKSKDDSDYVLSEIKDAV
ncbi:MAG: efflux RND transporter permease subunit [Bacteroidota bacterium]